MVSTKVSKWINVKHKLPKIEGVYETKDDIGVTGFQRYKDGYWGSYNNSLEAHIKSYPPTSFHTKTCYPPTYWRGIIEEEEKQP